MIRAVRTASIVLGVAAVLYSAAWVMKAFAGLQAIDFYIYYVAAHLDESADVDDIYGHDVQSRVGEEEYARAQQGSSKLRKLDATYRRTLDNVSSPFLYTCFTWLPRDYDVALATYRALLIVSFGVAVLLLGAAARLPWVVTLFLTAALLRFYFPFHADVIIGNVNSFQFLLIALAVAAGRRFPAIGGAVIGLLIAFKPTLGYMVVLLFLAHVASRDFVRVRREILGGAAGMAAAFLAASLNFGGPRVWLQWLPAAGGFFGRLPGRDSNNVTPALALFERFGTRASPFIALALLLGLAIILFRRRKGDDVVVAGLGILVYLLTAPVVWLHYLVLAIPLAVALLREPRTAPVALAALFAMSGQWAMFLGGSPRPLDERIVTPALVALFVAGAWMLAHEGRDRRIAFTE